MKIVAYFNKPVTWVVEFHKNGLINTSKYGQGTRQTFNIPIFRGRLTFDNWYNGNTSTSYIFSLVDDSSEDACVRALMDEEQLRFSMTDRHALPMFQHVINKSTPFYTHHDDGSIEGTFMFQKSGSSINIAPYFNPIDELNTDITLT